MANIDRAPSKHMLNLIHILPAFADESKLRINTLVELNSMTINKYEIITESGQLKLDRVGFSSLAYPFAYGAIPCTWDEDGDPLDVEIVGVTEPLVPGCLAEVRIIGIMKFDDGGEVDDKVIGVLADDKRMDHITSYTQLGSHWEKRDYLLLGTLQRSQKARNLQSEWILWSGWSSQDHQRMWSKIRKRICTKI